VEKLSFGHSMEALLAAAKPALDAALVAELQAIGLDPTKKLLPAYPATVARDAVLRCARKLNPHLTEEAALFALGRRFVERYRESIMGAALAAAARLLGPKRMLNRVAVQFGNANNYIQVKMTHVAPGVSELWASEIQHSAWFAGIITAMVENARAKNVNVTLQRNDASGAVFQILWSE
jgi:uncharacterized protein (TIGR02265 family)